MRVVVDYGMGNLRSIANAASFLGKRVTVSASPDKLKKAKQIIFPGVGHFSKAMLELRKRKLLTVLKGKIKEGTPFLGICLGMQLLFEESQESGRVKGLSVLAGQVKRFDSRRLVVPHMGWNRVQFRNGPAKNSGLFKGVKDKAYFYFAHSYYCVPQDKKIIVTTTFYGPDFTSSLRKNNIWAVQFHPEKSQKEGLKLFGNFLTLS